MRARAFQYQCGPPLWLLELRVTQFAIIPDGYKTDSLALVSYPPPPPPREASVNYINMPVLAGFSAYSIGIVRDRGDQLDYLTLSWWDFIIALSRNTQSKTTTTTNQTKTTTTTNQTKTTTTTTTNCNHLNRLLSGGHSCESVSFVLVIPGRSALGQT